MAAAKDPATFWREQSIYHQGRAALWLKVSKYLGGILTGIVIVLIVAVKVSS